MAGTFGVQSHARATVESVSPTSTTPRVCTASARLAEGIYSIPQAGNIVGRRHRATGKQLRRWLAVVVPPSGVDTTPDVISFLDLVSLEAVCRLRDQGVSLQRVRKALDALHRVQPDIAHPLARRSFFTDGMNLWGNVVTDSAEEIVGRNRAQFVLLDAIKTFAHEIRFIDDLASAWDIAPWVGIDPAVCFGAPVVRGTRIPVSTIMTNIAEATEEEVADWYGLSVRQVRGVVDYAK